MRPEPHRSPSRYDPVTIPCPGCQRLFTPTGKRRYCSDRCRVSAWRRRQAILPPAPATLPQGRPRRPVTVYECPGCGERALGEQRCDSCGSFMNRVGLGGHCPECDTAVAISEIFDAEATDTRPSPPHRNHMARPIRYSAGVAATGTRGCWRAGTAPVAVIALSRLGSMRPARAQRRR